MQYKECPEHGCFETPVWKGLPALADWEEDALLSPPVVRQTTALQGCPYDCGVCENHRQQACCVVMEITQRCNQACPVCYAAAGGEGPADRPLELIEEDLRFLRASSEERPFNLQFSGGEPTLRDDLPAILRKAAELGFPYRQLNTNGRRLAQEEGYAGRLKAAGLSAVFLQFDGLSDDTYRSLRGEPLLAIKKEAVRRCAEAGLGVVLVVTLEPDVNGRELGAILNYAAENLPAVRGIHIQPLASFGRYPVTLCHEASLPPRSARREYQARLTMPELFRMLEEQSGGAVRAEFLHPLRSGHPRCSFHGRFYLDEEGDILPVPGSGSREGCRCGKDAIIKARDFLADKWTLPGPGGEAPDRGAGYDVSGWDRYLRRLRLYGFSLTGMFFQDAETLDLQRLSACRVHVLSPDRRLIPFCAYNLTARDGTPLYRGAEGAL